MGARAAMAEWPSRSRNHEHARVAAHVPPSRLSARARRRRREVRAADENDVDRGGASASPAQPAAAERERVTVWVCVAACQTRAVAAHTERGGAFLPVGPQECVCALRAALSHLAHLVGLEDPQLFLLLVGQVSLGLELLQTRGPAREQAAGARALRAPPARSLALAS
eukprot:3117520-Prymnesium_polylepis.1